MQIKQKCEVCFVRRRRTGLRWSSAMRCMERMPMHSIHLVYVSLHPLWKTQSHLQKDQHGLKNRKYKGVTAPPCPLVQPPPPPPRLSIPPSPSLLTPQALGP